MCKKKTFKNNGNILNSVNREKDRWTQINVIKFST